MQPNSFNRLVTTSWIVRTHKIPASTVKFHIARGYLRAVHEPAESKLWRIKREDADAYAARRKHVLQAN